MENRTKFEDFITKYNISFNKKVIGENTYKTFRNWLKGSTKNPTVQMIMKFYNLYKHEINYDMSGLMRCFYEYEVFEHKIPLIYSVTTNNKMYNSLFCNKIVKELSCKNKILIFDEDTYSNISQINTPDNTSFKFDTFNIYDCSTEKLNKVLLKTSNPNVDFVYLKRLNGFHYYSDKDIYNQIKELRNVIFDLQEYNLVIFNFWEEENNGNNIYSRISDYLFYIANGGEEITESRYFEFINYNNNLTVLHSKISNIYDHIQSHRMDNISEEKINQSFKIIDKDYNEEENTVEILSNELIKELDDYFRVFISTFNRI